MRSRYIIAVAGMLLITSCVRGSGTDIFSIDGRPLERLCLADDERARSACMDHIDVVLGEYTQARKDRVNRNAFAACYYGELTTLRAVALRSYRELLQLNTWLDSVDGRARTASSPESVENFRLLFSRIEPASTAIQEARETRKVRWRCRLSPFIWS